MVDADGKWLHCNDLVMRTAKLANHLAKSDVVLFTNVIISTHVGTNSTCSYIIYLVTFTFSSTWFYTVYISLVTIQLKS